MKEVIKSIIYKLFSPFIIRRGKKNCIYITFDDGPHPENTPKIVDTLNKYNIHATFFMTGIEMKKYPDKVKCVIDSGHTIAYHGYSHQSMKKQSLKEFIQDIRQARALEDLFGIRLILYRPPFGDVSPLGFFYLILSGWKIVMWSLDSRDSYDSETQILETVAPDNLTDGEILLFHDDYSKTAYLLDQVFERCKQAKLSFGDEF